MNLHKLYTWLQTNRWLVLICVFALLFRFYTISDNHVFFFFDQSRDATISRQILEEKDIKIQGPSASGTNDSLYHGVLYYYLIGPLYTLFVGNPAAVAGAFSILSLITILTIYKLTIEMTENKTSALFAASLTALSAHAALSATWLSNPQLALITIPLFYLTIWRIFKTHNPHILPWAALFLGLSHQSIIFTIYLFLPILIAFLYLVKTNPLQKIIKPLTLSIIIYLLTISTMILTQLQLARSGIFKLSYLAGGNGLNVTLAFDSIRQVYTELAQWAFLPNIPVLSIILTITVLVLGLIKANNKIRLFALIWLVAPISLLFVQPRNSGHTLMGTLPLLYVLCALAVVPIIKQKWGTAVLVGLLGIFSISNLQAINTVRATARHPMVIQFGATLKDQLQAIDYTYSKASPVSINTLTVPYKVNTTWAYLYNWYGQQKYAKKPYFTGSNQANLPGGTFLTAASYAQTPNHASIIEPLQGIPEYAQTEFAQAEQANSGKVIEEKKFGSLTIQLRQK